MCAETLHTALAQTLRDVVLAEDDRDDQYLFSDALALAGPTLRLQCVSNGAELLTLLQHTLPDLLFLGLERSQSYPKAVRDQWWLPRLYPGYRLGLKCPQMGRAPKKKTACEKRFFKGCVADVFILVFH